MDRDKLTLPNIPGIASDYRNIPRERLFPTAVASSHLVQSFSKREPTVFQLMTFQIASKYSALRFSYCR